MPKISLVPIGELPIDSTARKPDGVAGKIASRDKEFTYLFIKDFGCVTLGNNELVYDLRPKELPWEKKLNLRRCKSNN